MTQVLSGKLFLIIGPSGSGKGTVIERLKGHYPAFVYPVSYTTRDPREGEVDGEVYHFISKEEFKEMVDKDEFLEYVVVHGDNYYGTSKAQIMEPLAAGAFVIREVDMQGFQSIRKLVPEENLVSIFMKVVDREDLKRRIEKRGEMSKEEFEARMKSALDEIAQADQCDYQVENHWGKVDQCVREVEKIIVAESEKLYSSS